MSVAACAEQVQRGDPDRFRAVMAAPVWAREKLFPLYAFNLEVARAPWVTKEPLIAEMRLQWWRDALDEIKAGGPVRRHEVTTPLAEALDATGAALLDRVIEARREDIGDGPQDAEAQRAYLAATGGALMQAAGRLLGAPEAEAAPLARHGAALATANWLLAYPALLAAGKRPFGVNAPDTLGALANDAIGDLRQAGRLSPTGRIAALPGWTAHMVLVRARRSPAAILEGLLQPSRARSDLALFWKALWMSGVRPARSH